MSLKTILGDHRHFHSSWQIDHAITAKSGGTLYGCYRQSVRELHKRWRGLRGLYSERVKLLEDCETAIGVQRCETRLQAVEADHVIADTEREFVRFWGQAVACRRALGLDDAEPMPEDLRERLESEFWEHQIRAMAAIDFITTGRLSRNTVEILAATKGDQRRRLVSAILNPQAHDTLIQWYLGHEPELPEPVEVLASSPREAIECVSRILSEQPESGIPAGWLSSPAESFANA
jgi:hypothetical protein